MKKVLKVFTVLMIVVSLIPNSINAETFVDDIYISANEYLMVKEAINSSDSKIRNTVSSNYRDEYIEHILSMKKYTDFELKSLYNYTDDQIYAIRNFDFSEEMIIRASSYVEVYGGFQSYNHSENYSSAEVVMAFNWYGEPAYYFKDIFAVTWTDFNAKSAEAVIGWTPSNPKYQYFSESVNVKASGIYSDYIEFEKRIIPSHNLHGGSITYELYAHHDVTDPVVFAAYGYNTINATPSVTFSSNGASVGISFGSFMTMADSARVYP